MPRFDYEEYRKQLKQDCDEMRVEFKKHRPGSAEYKVTSGNYIRLMNSYGNALANAQLHAMGLEDDASSGKHKLRLIPNGDSNTE